MKDKILKEIRAMREKRIDQRGLKELLDNVEGFVMAKESIIINEVLSFIDEQKSGKLSGMVGRNNASLQRLKETIRAITKQTVNAIIEELPNNDLKVTKVKAGYEFKFINGNASCSFTVDGNMYWLIAKHFKDVG